MAQMTDLRPSAVALLQPDDAATPLRWFASMLAAFGLLAAAVVRDAVGAVGGRFVRRHPSSRTHR